MVASIAAPAADAIPILALRAGSLPDRLAGLPETARAFAAELGFDPKPGRHLIVPDAAGGIAAVLVGAETEGGDAFAVGRLALSLPAGRYRLDGDGWPEPALAAVGWVLSAYRFTRYKAAPGEGERAVLCLPTGVDPAQVARVADATTLARDLVNTPANDLGPDALEAAVLALAQRHGAEAAVIRGEALRTGFPLIHAVGQAAAEAPRLVDLTWGDAAAPAVTLVGKGVTFDTGGLDIKPESAMGLMKKDMAGAATALALAHMVMDAGLPVRLRVLVPIVENAISASAFRPGDIYRSRKGLTVEIGNTDAEGRLILADALAYACETPPALLFDFATLTGAARIALGPDLPPFYTDDETLAADVARCARAVQDPVWRMPLWRPYDSLLDGKVADLNNISGGPFAGSVTAALFLRRFVAAGPAWAHFDIYGWNPSTKPGRPEGGETQAARALFALLAERYPA